MKRRRESISPPGVRGCHYRSDRNRDRTRKSFVANRGNSFLPAPRRSSSPAVLGVLFFFVTPMPPRYAALSLTLLALLPVSAFARKQETGFLDRAITVSGETYRYQVFVPYNWDKHKKWPVILF